MSVAITFDDVSVTDKRKIIVDADIITSSAADAEAARQAAEEAEASAESASGYAESASASAEAAGESAESAAASAEEAEQAVGGLTEDVEELQEQMQAKAPVIISTASGSIASFSDGADDMPCKSVVCQVDAVQSGSGDPSPTNVRPITGWDGVSVVRTGKNLIKNKNASSSGESNGISWTKNNDGSITLSGTATATAYINFNVTTPRQVLAYGNVTLVNSAIASYNPTSITGINFQCDIYVDGVYSKTLQKGAPSATFAGGEISVGIARLAIASGTVVPSGTVFYPQIEIGSSATDFEPYVSDSHSLSFPQTVYGGWVDVVKGELHVTHGYVDLGSFRPNTKFHHPLRSMTLWMTTRCCITAQL